LNSFPVSPLFVPANKLEWIQKAESSEADGLIIDLEDSVPEEYKKETREALADYLSSTEITKPFFIRINPMNTSHGEKDINIFKETVKSFKGLIIPKIEDPVEIASLNKEIKVVLLIETPLALENLSLLSQSDNVIGLALGGADLSAELGSDMSWDSLLMARSMIVLQASKNGLLTIDSPFMQINDEKLLAEESWKAKSIGFNSKFAIHPKQAKIIKERFLPTKEEIEEAEKIIEAYSNSKGGAISVDGKMVDEPIVRLMKKRLWLVGIDLESK
tara:strand:- start:12546 stop:13367 length:822 start_codon:yes stop_codon:yes gene_type:complete